MQITKVLNWPTGTGDFLGRINRFLTDSQLREGRPVEKKSIETELSAMRSDTGLKVQTGVDSVTIRRSPDGAYEYGLQKGPNWTQRFHDPSTRDSVVNGHDLYNVFDAAASDVGALDKVVSQGFDVVSWTGPEEKRIPFEEALVRRFLELSNPVEARKSRSSGVAAGVSLQAATAAELSGFTDMARREQPLA